MRAVVIIITAALCCAGGARAETVTVQPGDSIQAAIDGNANGTEIVLLPGTYHELIDLRGRAVTIRSSDPEDRDVVLDTVIDGSGLDGSVITCATGEGPDTRLEGLTITGGEGTVRGMYRVGGGLYNYLASPTVTNCVFLENHADGGGGIWNFYGYAVISGCEFRANTNGFSSYGGAAIENQGGAPVIINCKFMDNSTPTRGGAIHNTNSTDPTIVNCIFARNSASYGGAILNASGDVTLVNCTLIDNVADSVDDATGGGLCVYDASQTVIYNCILRGNSPSQIGMFPGSTPEVSYSNIEDGWSGDGSDNIDVDPAFVDPESDDLRLRSESLCVDAGEENMLPEYATMDLGGNARVANVTVDVGAYELQEEPDPPAPSTDLNGDGFVNVLDLLQLLSAWGACPAPPADCPADFNGSGAVDVLDLLTLLADWG